jgi:hypothetical protein
MANWSRVPSISEADLQVSFEKVREERFFTDEFTRNRRATWLYPDDGCFVRATVADDMIGKLSPANPTAKIFAFGNLQVQSTNSPSGAVEWWYLMRLSALTGKLISFYRQSGIASKCWGEIPS